MVNTKIGFIGAGRLASVVAPELARADCNVAAVASRTRDSADKLARAIKGCAVVEAQELSDLCDLIFVTTADAAIAEVTESLQWRETQAVVHCSGALTREPLSPAERMGARTGSLHPFQTFGAGGTTASLSGVTFGIEAEPNLYDDLSEMVDRFGGVALRVPEATRPLYHAASVMSSGYLVTLLHEAHTLWEKAGLPPDAATAAIGRLAETTLANVIAAGTHPSLSGPTSRGDKGTVRLHLEAMAKAAPELLPLYTSISERSAILAREAGRPGGSIDWSALFTEYVEHHVRTNQR